MSTWRLDERESCVSVLKSYFHVRTSSTELERGGAGSIVAHFRADEWLLVLPVTLRAVVVAAGIVITRTKTR